MESEQRTSALQQRLQARREMFMKETGSINNINNTGNAQPIYGSKVNTPSTAPPQPPTNAPRATKDSSIYGNKVGFLSVILCFSLRNCRAHFLRIS